MIIRVYTKISESLLVKTQNVLGNISYPRNPYETIIVLNLSDYPSVHWYTYDEPNIDKQRVMLSQDHFSYLLDLISFGFTFSDQAVIDFLTQCNGDNDE